MYICRGFFPPFVVPTSKCDLGQTLGQWEDFQRYDGALDWQAPKIYMKNTTYFNWMQEWTLSHAKWEMFAQSGKILFS